MPVTIAEYRVSFYGRIGYLIMSCFGLIMLLIFSIPMWYTPSKPVPLATIELAGVALLFFGSVLIFCVSVRRLFGSSMRIAIYPQGFIYDGFFGKVYVQWVNIESYRLGYAGKAPFLYLHIQLKKNNQGWRKGLMLDISGLKPDKQSLLREFTSRSGISAGDSSPF